jgi:hypothetical protein
VARLGAMERGTYRSVGLHLAILHADQIRSRCVPPPPACCVACRWENDDGGLDRHARSARDRPFCPACARTAWTQPNKQQTSGCARAVHELTCAHACHCARSLAPRPAGWTPIIRRRRGPTRGRGPGGGVRRMSAAGSRSRPTRARGRDPRPSPHPSFSNRCGTWTTPFRSIVVSSSRRLSRGGGDHGDSCCYCPRHVTLAEFGGPTYGEEDLRTFGPDAACACRESS